MVVFYFEIASVCKRCCRRLRKLCMLIGGAAAMIKGMKAATFTTTHDKFANNEALKPSRCRPNPRPTSATAIYVKCGVTRYKKFPLICCFEVTANDVF